jgi:ribonuclease HI
MNNVVEYSIIIELLCDAISHGVRSLEVLLDSQLVICQLNVNYRV